MSTTLEPPQHEERRRVHDAQRGVIVDRDLLPHALALRGLVEQLLPEEPHARGHEFHADSLVVEHLARRRERNLQRAQLDGVDEVLVVDDFLRRYVSYDVYRIRVALLMAVCGMWAIGVVANREGLEEVSLWVGKFRQTP